jgi:soluble lytic murein transglycosylase
MAAIVGVAAGLRAASGPAADLKTAIEAINDKRFVIATPLLAGLAQRLPELADYAGWYLAAAQAELKNYAAVPAALEPVFAQQPKSPLRGRASLLAADAYLKLGRPAEAIRVLSEYYTETTPPQSDMALGDAFLAAGDKVNAAVYYQRVYFGYPQSPAAPRAQAALEKLKQDLGEDYPPAMPHAMLGRAMKLLAAGDAAAARKEFEALVPQLGGGERDLARVRIGVALYNARQDKAAYDYLANLGGLQDDADAERLHYLTQAARRLGKLDLMEEWAGYAASLYPKSHWTVTALIAAGNRYLTENNPAKYEPLFQACYENAPSDPDSEWCHWKVTWLHYLRRQPDAANLLRDHLKFYPASENSPAALYFLGRLAEQSGDRRAARAYFGEIVDEYPNMYYATLAQERLPGLGTVIPAETVQGFLKTVAFPLRSRKHDFHLTDGAASRIRRAALLARADLKDLAEGELRFGADSGDQPHLLAMELAKLLGSGNAAQALRYIKRYARGYLLTPLDSAPREFWRLAFPLPYRTELDRYAQQYRVDPYLLAALIRQESEFDPRAVSATGARGLAQIQPATGRDLAQRLKLAYTADKLFQPAFNLQLSAFYLDWLMQQLDGNREAVLASYNAGMSRAKTWLKWADFREPAEFIETIPITQTREYVQAVERNAAVYRAIYGE